MEFLTIDQWDEKLWEKASFIYFQAFQDKGCKPEKIIRNMFKKRICVLHLAIENSEVVAMALTGMLYGGESLLIDYLAVLKEVRGKGIGYRFVEYLKQWCKSNGQFSSILVEIESDLTPENIARQSFWIKCGFTLTDYIHHYIWVPEPYRTMFVNLYDKSELPEDGEKLFEYIGQFHKESFQIREDR